MIRQVAREDIPGCVELIRESFLTVADEFGFTPQNAPRFTAFSTNRPRLESQFEDPCREMYLCEEQGGLIGYVSLLRLKEKTCELNNLCVKPSCRHCGTGRTLLEFALRRAEELDCTSVSLGIVEENGILRTWY